MSLGGITPITAVLLADTGEFSAKMDESIGKMTEFGAVSQTTGEKVAGVWGKMSTLVLGAGLAVGAVSVDLAFKYNEALDTMQRTTHLTGAQMEYLKGQILTVSSATATSAEDITGGLTQLIKAGENEKQALRDVGQAAKFTQAAGGDLNDTLTAAIGIQKQHITGTKNMTQTLNIFDTAIKHSQLTADELDTALSGKSLSTFSAYHVDLRTATTLLAGFADENLTGTKALMALKGGYTALDAPTRSTTGAISESALTLGKLKLSQATLAEEARKPGGILQVLQQINTAFNENGTAQQKAEGIASVMQQIFGTSAGPAYTNLIKELPQLDSLYEKINNSKGSVDSSFTEFLHSPAGAVAQFKTALENAAIRIGDVILPKLTVGLMDVTHLVTDISKSKTEQSFLAGGLETIVGAALATKLTTTLLTAAKGLGVGGDVVTGASSAEIASVGAGVGVATAGGIAAFLGTTEILRHNFLGLGTAVTKTTGYFDHLFGFNNDNSTVQYGKKLAGELGKHGITNNATVGLGSGTIDYILGLKNKNGSKGKVTIRNTTKVGLK